MPVVTMYKDWTDESEQILMTMLTDSLLLVGLAVAIVLLILVGCKIVIDFPGLLDGNIVHIFKEINAEEEVFKNIKVIKNLDLPELTEISEKRTPKTVEIEVEPSYPAYPQTNTQEKSFDETGLASRITESRQKTPDIHSAIPMKNKDREIPELHKNIKFINKHQNFKSAKPSKRTPTGSSTFLFSSPDTTTTSLSRSMPKSCSKLAQINIISGEVNIVIKSQKQKENFSISIDFPGEDVSKQSEPHKEMINNPSETSHDSADREDRAQCQYHQTKEHINRHC